MIMWKLKWLRSIFAIKLFSNIYFGKMLTLSISRRGTLQTLNVLLKNIKLLTKAVFVLLLQLSKEPCGKWWNVFVEARVWAQLRHLKGMKDDGKWLIVQIQQI